MRAKTVSMGTNNTWANPCDDSIAYCILFLTLCLLHVLGNFLVFLSSANFFQIRFFEKKIQEYNQSVK